MDRQLADLAELILGISRELRFRTDAGTVHLTPSEAHVMRYIDHHPGATPSDVARFTGLQRSNLSTALRALEKRDFVDRRTDPDDARGVNLFPTRRAAENLARLRQQWARQVAAALGDDQRHLDEVAGVLSRLEERLVETRLG